MILDAIKKLNPNHPHFKVVGDPIYENIFIHVNEPGLEYKNIQDCTAEQKKDIPSKTEIEDKIKQLLPDIELKNKKNRRIQRYKYESDNLFMEYQYLEGIAASQTVINAKKQEWIDKVNQIKSDIPLI